MSVPKILSPAHAGKDAAQAACDYDARGWKLVQVPFREKAAKGKAWQNANPRPDTFKATFNIGVQLGPKSGGLVDIDLDCPQAIALADEFFPELRAAAFGRFRPDGSHVLGHRLVICADIPEVEAKAHAYGFKKVDEQAALTMLGLPKSVVLEVRAGKGYTGFPPSFYGEDRLLWRADPRNDIGARWDFVPDLPTMPFAEVQRRAGLLAFASLVLAAYPTEGDRDNYCLRLAGALVHAGVSEEAGAAFIRIVAKAADDEDAGKRGDKMAATIAKKAEGGQVNGLPGFLEPAGLEACEKSVRKWLGMEARTKEAKGGTGKVEPPPGSWDIGHPNGVELAEAIYQRLHEKGIMIFRRDTEVIRIHRFEKATEEGSVKFDADTTVLRSNDWRWIRTELSQHMVFYRWTKAGPVECMPTIDNVRLLEDRVVELRMPEIKGLTHVPTLDRDEPGYDPVSKVLHTYNVGDFPRVPENPTKADALERFERIMHHARRVCFASPVDRAVYAAYLMTCVARKSVPCAPAFGFSAPYPRSGKSMLVQCGSILASGNEVPTSPYYGAKEKDDASWESLLSSGAPLVCLDNASAGIYNDLICQSLTSTSIKVRRYGFNDRTLTLPTNTTVAFTGNHLRILRDMKERTLRCELMPATPLPGELKFDFRPEDEVRSDRAALVVDVLTILKAYRLASDKPTLRTGFGGFEDWSNSIRGAIVWLGLDDPMGSMKKVRDEADEEGDLRTGLAVLYGRFGLSHIAISEVAKDETCVRELGPLVTGGRWDNRKAGYLFADWTHKPSGGLVMRPVAGASPKCWTLEGTPDEKMRELVELYCSGDWGEQKLLEWEARNNSQVPS